MTRVKLWQAKLKAVKAEERQWTKLHSRSVKALTKIAQQINHLEKKIEVELAKSQ
jgi:hypothetical protein